MAAHPVFAVGWNVMDKYDVNAGECRQDEPKRGDQRLWRMAELEMPSH